MGTLNEQARPRLAYIDTLKATVIIMVVLIHACVTYSGIGSWFYKEPSALDPFAKLVFEVYESFSQSFFMGLLFFVAATFMPASYDRKGFGRFLADRCVRLGIPVPRLHVRAGPAHQAHHGSVCRPRLCLACHGIALCRRHQERCCSE